MKKMFLFIFALFLCFSNSFGQDPQKATLKIKVIAPKNTPENDTLRVVGNQPNLGNWFFKDAAKMTEQPDGSWYYQASYPKHTHVEFKITRGSFMTEALYNASSYVPSFSTTLEKDTLFTIRPKFWKDMINNSVTGNLRYHHDYADPNLRFTRDVFVWLPPSYEENPYKHYPVLYMHDGQNLFDASRSGAFGSTWRMDEVTDSLIQAGAIEEIIIVGIANTKDRWTEYSGLPRGKDYANFVVNNLKPFIDKTYRTMPGRKNTAVMGSSMGGLISLYFVLWYPEVFSKAGMLSNGFIYDEAEIMDHIKSMPLPKKPIRLYMDCGDVGLDEYFLPANKKMYHILKERGIAEIEFVIEPGAKHNEQAWAKRIWKPLVYLFGQHKSN